MSAGAESLLPRLEALLERLTLEEKVRLLTGRDFWTTWPIEKIALRRMLVSDGPSGVRGELWDERSPSLNLPSATALASSWDPVIAARYGSVSAAEARRKGVDVVLGPTVNLHRSPLGGRHFEAFSEDPHLTAELAAAYVDGVQRNGVGATLKHYVANDFETDRKTVDVRVGERALRELYLAAFERAVVESRAWLVMSAYNAVNGVTATENELLRTPLNDEWGFDGVVVSDWTAVRSLESARHEQDLVMPGPHGPWGDALVTAVREGEIPVQLIDRKVLRILLLAARVGALEGFDDIAVGLRDQEDGEAFAREAAVEGSVLLRNDGVLPLSGAEVRSIAVIGHNARDPRSQGGGSATVLPEHVVSPLEGIRRAFPGARVTYRLGAVVQQGVAEFSRASLTNPVTGTPGAHVRLVSATGETLSEEERLASALVFFGGGGPVEEAAAIEFTTRHLPEESGEVRIGFAGVGHGRLWVDGRLILDAAGASESNDVGAALFSPPSITVPVTLHAGREVELRLEFRPARAQDGAAHAFALTVGTEPAQRDPAESIAEAVAAARDADVAIVVVGTNSTVESEGFDRTSLQLPGAQDRLVEAVTAVNERTVVVVNAGAPVELPWRERAAAVLLTYFAGQEFGNAVADILDGSREPGGRLPTTWPTTLAETPVSNVTPEGGVVRYDEGIHIGYRAWLRADREPAYPFGHGLGYTTWRIGPHATATPVEDGWIVEVPVTNTGSRSGKQVVQVYAERADSAVERPVRWLVGSAVIRSEAGGEERAKVLVSRRSLSYWDGGWRLEAGTYTLRVGTSVEELPLSVPVTV